MRRESLDDVAMAALINEGLSEKDRCTGYAVKKWKYHERQAPADKIVRIEEVTNHEVTLRDLIQISPEIPESESAAAAE